MFVLRTIHQIVELIGYSNDFISEIKEEVDFCFIDGDHSKSQFYIDGCLIFEKIKIRGLMVTCGFVTDKIKEKE